MVRDNKAGTVTADLAAIGIQLKAVHGPRTASGLVSVVIPAGSAAELDVAATAASLLASACQDFTAAIVGVPETGMAGTRAWLGSDARFSWQPGPRTGLHDANYTLVLPAGTRLGTFSIEALVDAAQATGAQLIRALVDGRTDSVEFWDSAVLNKANTGGDPEKSVRAAGGERWVSGSSVGVHDFRQPAPRLHLRKGAAGRHDLTVLVRDATDAAVRADYEQRIRQLEAKVSRAEADSRRLEAGTSRQRGAARLAAVARRGPGYITSRAKAMLGRARNS